MPGRQKTFNQTLVAKMSDAYFLGLLILVVN
jgi:hypothetical protein